MIKQVESDLFDSQKYMSLIGSYQDESHEPTYLRFPYHELKTVQNIMVLDQKLAMKYRFKFHAIIQAKYK